MKIFMMISLALLILSQISAYARGNCSGLSTKVDNSKIYAEVISRGHMDLELVLVKKAFYSAKLKVTGGYGYHANNLPTCELNEVDSLNWVNRNIATYSTFDYDYHTAAYAICSYDFRGELVDSYIICNYEIGD